MSKQVHNSISDSVMIRFPWPVEQVSENEIRVSIPNTGDGPSAPGYGEFLSSTFGAAVADQMLEELEHHARNEFIRRAINIR
jgi:hypothetical protein